MDSSMLITKSIEDVKENIVLVAAKKYVEQGVSVFPVVSEGKKPLLPWKPYQKNVPTETELESWFVSGSSNIGIVTGELSGVIVLDFDTAEAWQEALRLGMPETPLAVTSRGFHAYFKYRPGIRNDQNGQVLAGMDIRGEGGYVVAPPSVHESGECYKWFNGRSLGDLQLAELPDWVVKSVVEKPALEVLEGGVSQGGRNETLTRLLGSWVKDNSHDVVVGKALEWNKSCDPPDDEQQVLRTVKSIWDRENAGLPEDIEPTEWEEPLLFDNVALTQMSSSLLPSFLGEFAGAVSKAIQAPEGMASMLGLSVAATALQKKVLVGPDEHGDYVEPVNVWAVVVADPSERKSPVLREMMAPVVAWEIEQASRIELDRSSTNTERTIIESRIKKLNTEAGNADTTEERARLAAQINELKNSLPDEVLAPVMWTGNVTPERLEQLMVDHNEKMSVMTDEGGIFEIMGGLYSNGKVNLDVFMQGYSGNPTRVDRASRSAHMKNPLLTLGLAIQPKVLEDLGHGSKRVFRGNGLLSRFLYYQCETHRGQRFYANQQQVSPEIRNRYVSGINRLLDIPLECDEYGSPAPTRLYLDRESKKLWVDFSDEIERKLVPGGEFDSVSDWAGKLAGNTLRVAGLFHVVEHGMASRAINSETVDRAIKLMKVLIPHAKSALNATANSGLANDAEHVCSWIVDNEHREFTRRDCHRALSSKFNTVKELEPVIAELIARSIVRRVPNIKGMGRPSDMIQSNPAIFV